MWQVLVGSVQWAPKVAEVKDIIGVKAKDDADDIGRLNYLQYIQNTNRKT